MKKLLVSLTRRIECIFRPGWKVIQEGPLTQNMYLYDRLVRVQESKYRIEENLIRKQRCIVTEPDGFEYKTNPNRLKYKK